MTTIANLELSIRKTQYGKGVFSRRRFRKGQRVGQMLGRLERGENYDPDYCVDMGSDGVLVPRAPFRYLNHSCEPNCELVEWEVEDDVSEVWVYALRSIQPHEQLTIDYAWPAEAAIECLCGAEGCRGYVVDEVELHLVKRRSRRPRKTA